MHIYTFIIIYTILYIIHSESIPYIQTFRHFRHTVCIGLVQPQGPQGPQGLTRPGESGRLEREPLPVHLDKVLKAFGDGLEESEKLHVNAGERCLGMAKADGMAKAFIKSILI